MELTSGHKPSRLDEAARVRAADGSGADMTSSPTACENTCWQHNRASKRKDVQQMPMPDV